ESGLSFWILLTTLIIAGVTGDALNYKIGRGLYHKYGEKIFGKEIIDERKGMLKFIKVEHLEKTQDFYAKHGGKTIIFARFMPIIRTFAPFVAGLSSMSYAQFAYFNVVGAVAWISSFLLLGYFFGSLPAIKSNFHLVIL